MGEMEEKHRAGMKLSVALCTFNGAKYLREQLNSIAEQDVKVDEVIACDDSSTDDTVSILREYADRKILPIKIVENNRQLGVTANFEQAILACTGDIIFCSDQDDIWMLDKTKVITEYFDHHPSIDFVFTDAELVGNDGERLTDKSLFDTGGLKSLAKMWDAGLMFEITNTLGNHTTGCTMALRKSMTQYAFPLKKGTNILHDFQLAIAAMKNGSIGMIHQCLIKYRLHGKNVCGIGNNWTLNAKKEPKWIKSLTEPIRLQEYFIFTPPHTD